MNFSLSKLALQTRSAWRISFEDFLLKIFFWRLSSEDFLLPKLQKSYLDLKHSLANFRSLSDASPGRGIGFEREINSEFNHTQELIKMVKMIQRYQ